jgi:hypothetical protein
MRINMASEFAETINEAYFQNTEGALLRNVIDAELHEVREVLYGLRGRYVKNCWCDAGDDAEHYVSCQRARALMGKLEV